jgi:hypothetical protein
MQEKFALCRPRARSLASRAGPVLLLGLLALDARAEGAKRIPSSARSPWC